MIKLNKVVFLDVDGVLNIMSDSYYSTAFVNLGDNPIDYHLLRRLEYIIEKTNATIVLSSSWNLEQFIIKMTQYRFKYLNNIHLERTPKGYCKNLVNSKDVYDGSINGCGG